MSAATELEAWVDDYLDYLRLERNLSAHSVAAYARDLARLLAYALERRIHHPDGIAEATLSALLSVSAEQGQSARSRARMLSGWRGFLRYLVAVEFGASWHWGIQGVAKVRRFRKLGITEV